MYKLFFIAKNNMKKQKGDMITFFILTFIAAFLIFDCVSAIFGLGKVLDGSFDKANGAHVIIINADSDATNECAEQAIKENSHIVSYERTPMLRFTTDYRNKDHGDYLQFMFLAEEINTAKEIMQIQGPDISYSKNDVLLPLNMKAGFKIGDTLQLKFDDRVYDFNVAGYLEDPYFCSTVNITVYSICISPEMMDELAEKEPGTVSRRSCHKGRIDSASDYPTNDLESEITESYKEKLSAYAETDAGINITDYMAINWEMMRGGSQFIPMIVMAVMLIFAVLILVIALVIISFSIKNFIQKNMKNTGILEASGYTVRELRLSLILQIVLVAFAGYLLGTIVALISFDAFGNVVSSILGLSWNQPFNPAAAVITLFILLLPIILVSASNSRAYQKVTTLDALRGGISTHNFRKNFFPFDKTPLPIPLVMALKEFTGGLGRNLLMIFISALLVISTLIGFGLVDNFGSDPQGMVKIMAFEMGDASVAGNTGGLDISDDLRALPGAENVLVNMGFEPTLSFGDHKDTAYTYAVDDMNYTKSTNLLEGRFPEKANEILVTSGVAGDFGLGCGDVVTIEYAGNKADYMITGINQRVERMGRTVYMRIDGAEKLLPGNLTSMYSYIVTAKEGVSYEELSAQIEGLIEDKDLDCSISNDRLFVESIMTTVSTSMSMICIAILLITILIVIFVESLVIRAKISREWKGMGISKAIGQTSGGLISQIMLSNIPAVAIGALIGALLSQAAGSAAIKAAFSLFVIKNVNFDIAPLKMAICFAGIIVTAIAAAAAAGLKVRKLKPVEMITEE